MKSEYSDILVIGAGMAGLACASALVGAGREVIVVDKGRGPGGRMAARRAEVGGQTVTFDHGAQYFTARDPGFAATVAAWEREGVVSRWPAAGEEAWVGVPGMNGPIRAMSEPLDVRWSTRALTLESGAEGWRVTCETGAFVAATVLVAVPAEQARDLLAAPAPAFGEVAASVSSGPCWAVMVGFAQALDLVPDTVRSEGGAISWAARNSAKPGRSGGECWVLHASPERSRALLDLPAEKVAAQLLADFFVQTGVAPVAAAHLAAHRWLYALPETVSGPPARYDPVARIGIAGDYLHSPRVEGAWLSGRALAEAVLSS